MKRLPVMVVLCVMSWWAVASRSVDACTNFLITRGASADGSTMISYSADSHVLYGELYHWPAATWDAGAMLDIREWDTGKQLGQIPQARQTYNVVGNINEHQVAIGETTFGGRKELQAQAGRHHGLRQPDLHRSAARRNARQAIRTMAELVEQYGYYSQGESFSIADPQEVWILELIGKGEGAKGAVWVADARCRTGASRGTRIRRASGRFRWPTVAYRSHRSSCN